VSALVFARLPDLEKIYNTETSAGTPSIGPNVALVEKSPADQKKAAAKREAIAERQAADAEKR
jgi:hypothetical protein